MINRWGTLCFLLGLCAVLARAGQLNPEAPVDVSPRYTVDGVALGMTEDEVRARWGEVYSYSRIDGCKILRRVPGVPWDPLVPQITLSDQGRVTEVTGYQLRYRSHLLLQRGCELSEVEKLGADLKSNVVSPCGNVGPLQRFHRELEGRALTAVGFRPEFMESPDKYTEDQRRIFLGVQILGLQTMDSYNRVGRKEKSARLRLACEVVLAYRGLRWLAETKGPFSP